MSTDNKTSKRIKEIRIGLGLTGAEFGQKLNVTKTAVSYWENGVRQPDASTINKIADLGDVSADYLLGRTDNPNYSVISTDYKGNNVEIVVDSKTNNYSQEQIQSLFDKLSSIGINVDDLIKQKK